MHKDTSGTDSCGAKPIWTRSTHELGTHVDGSTTVSVDNHEGATTFHWKARSTHEFGTHVDGSTNLSADKHEALTTFHWTTFHWPCERPKVFADLCRHSSGEFGPSQALPFCGDLRTCSGSSEKRHAQLSRAPISMGARASTPWHGMRPYGVCTIVRGAPVCDLLRVRAHIFRALINTVRIGIVLTLS